MSLDARLSRLMPTLSARERAILVLRSWKDKTDEDPLWRRTMPADQTPEFNHLIGVMNGVNTKLGHVVTFLEKEVEKLELLEAWLFTLYLWQTNLAEIEVNASVVAREVITASSYASLQEQAASEYVLVSELASELAAKQRAWSDEDLSDSTFAGERNVKPEAWDRLCLAAEEQLREGGLDSRGKGKALRILRSSYAAWLGEPAKPKPAWAEAYEVVPDEDWLLATVSSRTIGHLQTEFAETPLSGRVASYFPGSSPSVESLRELVGAKIQRGLEARWMEVRALALVGDEIGARDFDGEDPFKPVFRELLDKSLEALTEMTHCAELFGVIVDLQDPTEPELQEWRDLVDRLI